MKQLKRRALFVLAFALLLGVGVGIFCLRLAVSGRDWASSSVNQQAYSSGKLASGVIYDRNGVLLYDCAAQTYGEGKLLRTATLHVVGDKQGNIAAGAKKLFSDKLVSYNPITGLSDSGNQLYLSIDAALNQTAYEALNGHSGVVAVYNYKTGELMCLVSAPSYDPTNDAQVEAVAAGDSKYDGAYINRFLSSAYTPGSVFKLVTAAAALEQLDTANFTFTCTGSYAIGGDCVTCPSAHGELDFQGALIHSCNGAFAALALELGGDTLAEYARQAGLLDSVTVSGYDSAAGSFTVAEDGTLDLGWSGVGQFKDLVNPAGMLTLMGCIAGNGKAATPRLLSKVTTQSGLPAALIATQTASIGWDTATCERLREMMRSAVTEVYGQDKFGALAVCAKSGTAEVGSSVDPHAWFAGFIDDADHPYAFVVVVENGGWGSSTAGTIAAKVLNQLCEEE